VGVPTGRIGERRAFENANVERREQRRDRRSLAKGHISRSAQMCPGGVLGIRLSFVEQSKGCR
jgi:hypothetical protein